MDTFINNRAVPASHDIRPERPDRVSGRVEDWFNAAGSRLGNIVQGRSRLQSMVGAIERSGERYRNLDDNQLFDEINRLRRETVLGGMNRSSVIQCFALVRELSHRVLGMKHYPCQLLGGLIMLQGCVAEMETGEGKTLTATLAASTAALAGIPVHVISVNDYLTSRDAENMRPLYEALGLSVGCNVHGLTQMQKRQGYECDITYVTNKELVFDYLRDRLTMGERDNPMLLQAEYLHSTSHKSRQMMLRGLHFAIVDEADSILIDEARTPLIISGSLGGDEAEQFFAEALELADKLTDGVDYVLDKAKRNLRITEVGKNQLQALSENMGPLWNGLVRRESMVSKALMAVHFYRIDEQYLVRNSKVVIIDEFTGRVMEDRSWEQGLHQLIEVKEGCELTQKRETLAKISYQRFFRRYLHLSGMTGTAREVAGEISFVYNMATVRVPTNRPLKREKLADRIYGKRRDKWKEVTRRLEMMHQQGRPVLVGTRTVTASEELAALAGEAGLSPEVLNARQDGEEADIVAKAGKRGAITIATNMAGRGTDIVLNDDVRELGGLHVIATERHEAARIDRQLAGRCGRQGDPGSHEAILSLEDYLFEGRSDQVVTKIIRSLGMNIPLLGPLLTRWLMGGIQKRVEKYHARVRRELFRQDQSRSSLLSFSGRLE